MKYMSEDGRVFYSESEALESDRKLEEINQCKRNLEESIHNIIVDFYRKVPDDKICVTEIQVRNVPFISIKNQSRGVDYIEVYYE